MNQAGCRYKRISQHKTVRVRIFAYQSQCLASNIFCDGIIGKQRQVSLDFYDIRLRDRTLNELYIDNRIDAGVDTENNAGNRLIASDKSAEDVCINEDGHRFSEAGGNNLWLPDEI